MDVYVRGLALYSAQILALVIAASASATVFRSARAPHRLAYWRLLLAACLLLPFVPQRVLEVDVRSAAAISAVIADGPVRAPVASGFSTAGAIVGVLAAGVLVRGLWLALGLARLRTLRRRAAPAELQGDLLALHRALAPKADVRWHDRIAQPVTFGVAPPVVLLPVRLRELPPQLQHAVLCHELFHANRRDWLAALAEEIIRTVFWFHPAVWWVIDRIQLCREETVDALAVSITASKRLYMQALLAFADISPLTLAPAPRFVRRRELVVRMKQLSQENRMSRMRIALSLVVVLLLVACEWAIVSAIPLRTDVRLRPAAAEVAPPAVSAPAGKDSSQPPSQGVIAPPLASAPRTGPVADGMSNPRLLSGPKPDYPSEAVAHSPGASVWVAVKIDSAGQVIEAKATKWRLTIEESIDDPNYWANKPERPFVEAAESAALQWKFAPPDAKTKTSIEVMFTFRNIRSSAPVVAASNGPAVAEAAPPPFNETATVVRVGGTIRPPTKIVDVDPIYPEDARAQHIEGVVVIEIRIAGNGTVREATVLRSIPQLDDAALKAVRQWQFTPTLLNGVPIDVIMNVTVNFIGR